MTWARLAGRDQADHRRLPAERGTRLRPLPARHRPRPRGPTARPAGGSRAGGPRPASTRRAEIAEILRATPAAAARAAGGHLPDAARAAGSDGHAPGGGDGVDRAPTSTSPRAWSPSGTRSSTGYALVPLHPSVTAALRAYAATRDRLCPTPRVDRFFVSVTGRALRRGEARPGLPGDHRADREFAPTPSTRAFMA